MASRARSSNRFCAYNEAVQGPCRHDTSVLTNQDAGELGGEEASRCELLYQATLVVHVKAGDERVSIPEFMLVGQIASAGFCGAPGNCSPFIPRIPQGTVPPSASPEGRQKLWVSVAFA